ncbi:MAG: chemotaxis protein CheC [Spartobacteria bacterium]|nr:chemotaxis protein CheC [Spartobacteria bacterium]
MMNQAEMDTLMEMVNIGVGEAAGVLSDMVSARVRLNVPMIHVLDYSAIRAKLPQLADEQISSVHLGYSGALDGTAILAFPSDSALALIRLLTGDPEDTRDMDVLRSSTLLEIGNVLLNSVMGTLGNLLEAPLTFIFPEYIECDLDDLVKPDQTGGRYVIADTHFMVESREIEGNIILVFEISSFETLKAALNSAEAKYDRD